MLIGVGVCIRMFVGVGLCALLVSELYCVISKKKNCNPIGSQLSAYFRKKVEKRTIQVGVLMTEKYYIQVLILD